MEGAELAKLCQQIASDPRSDTRNRIHFFSPDAWESATSTELRAIRGNIRALLDLISKDDNGRAYISIPRNGSRRPGLVERWISDARQNLVDPQAADPIVAHPTVAKRVLGFETMETSPNSSIHFVDLIRVMQAASELAPRRQYTPLTVVTDDTLKAFCCYVSDSVLLQYRHSIAQLTPDMATLVFGSMHFDKLLYWQRCRTVVLAANWQKASSATALIAHLVRADAYSMVIRLAATACSFIPVFSSRSKPAMRCSPSLRQRTIMQRQQLSGSETTSTDLC